MPTAKSSATESDTEPKHSNNGNGKTPAKPISLYPMSEEEAVKRLLRVPPPDKDRGMEGERIMSSAAKPVGGQAATKSEPNQAVSLGAPMTLTITVTGNKQTHTEIRETKANLR